ncbi:hypothetical protein PR048_002767 [Dryococelus australis]|uniref:Maturase n=1 Tax=Dryococelus australis TaxID=614101 RepID=A0ABQ9IL40_9NEOP|nr:hypothetical protein PR048_002767 [Dryococelus australis]
MVRRAGHVPTYGTVKHLALGDISVRGKGLCAGVIQPLSAVFSSEELIYQWGAPPRGLLKDEALSEAIMRKAARYHGLPTRTLVRRIASGNNMKHANEKRLLVYIHLLALRQFITLHISSLRSLGLSIISLKSLKLQDMSGPIHSWREILRYPCNKLRDCL